eukprot:949905-Pleurochrysis_carterae.AAC.1
MSKRQATDPRENLSAETRFRFKDATHDVYEHLFSFLDRADKANFLVTVRDALDRAEEGVVKVDEPLYVSSLEAAVRSADENHPVSLGRLLQRFHVQLIDDAAPALL